MTKKIIFIIAMLLGITNFVNAQYLDARIRVGNAYPATCNENSRSNALYYKYGEGLKVCQSGSWVAFATGAVDLSPYYTKTEVDGIATLTNFYNKTASDARYYTQSQVDTNILSAVPSQTTHNGKYLTTNGTVTSWATVATGDTLPSQTGNSGKYLTTNGSATSWGAVSAGAVGADKEPTSPDSRNDEFNASSLDAKWGLSYSGTTPTLGYDDVGGQAYMTSSATGAVFMEQSYTPAGDFSITAKFHIPSLGTSSGGIGGIQVQTTYPNGNTTGLLYEANFNTNYIRFIQRSGYVVLNSSLEYPVGSKYIHLERKSGTYYGYVSNDGLSWIRTYTTASYSGSVINSFNIRLESGSSTKMRIGVDWVRVNWLFLE